MNTEVFYHGSTVLFDRFDLSHALEGDGKMKFGYGVYVTQRYKTAAHYAVSDKNPDIHYIYTVEIPAMIETNHIWSNRPVHPEIIRRTEERLGIAIPEELKAVGKMFRKYVGNKLLNVAGTVKQLSSKASKEAELEAARFLNSIGVDFLVWPYNQKNPDGEQNRAIINDQAVKVLKVERVDLDPKKQFVEGSNIEVEI